MIRVVLCLCLSAATLAVGLWTAALQSSNYERGLALNDLKERCSMLEAINGDQSAQILARDCAPLPPEPKPATAPPAKSPARDKSASIAQVTGRSAEPTRGGL